jgi:Tol biopolymer transport system component
MHSSHTKPGARLRFAATRSVLAAIVLGLIIWSVSATKSEAQPSLREQLKTLPFKIAYECYVDGNWEIFVANADGSGAVNLTATPHEHEHYPQVSSDGKRICFLSDTGEGRSTLRSLYVMDIDGRNRTKIADHAQQPFWSPDSQVIGYLPQLYPKFSASDGYSDGMVYFDLQTGKLAPHPNSAKLHQLYNPSFDPGGKWIAATVHAGMDIGHAIVLIEAHGNKIIKLKIPGCRPCLSPDGKQIAWGADDHELAVAPLDLASDNPVVGDWRLRIKDDKNKIYHVDWSPDGRFLSFSRGPEGEGDPNKPGTYQAACEMIGVYSPGWNIYVVSAERSGTLDLNKAGENEVAQLTTNGCSNKEPAWFRAHPPASH